jgi:hypothetical protein
MLDAFKGDQSKIRRFGKIPLCALHGRTELLEIPALVLSR